MRPSLQYYTEYFHCSEILCALLISQGLFWGADYFYDNGFLHVLRKFSGIVAWEFFSYVLCLFV